MITRRQFDEICGTKRRAMKGRLKARYWKSGKRAGTLRTPGRDLPFSLQQFRDWAMKAVGLGAVRCHYCPRAIDILSFEPDHFVPLDLGGGYGLDNLVPSCEDCNRLKDAMPPQDFIDLMVFLEEKLSRPGAANVKKRLRAGSMGIKNRWPSKKAAPGATQEPIPTTQELDFF